MKSKRTRKPVHNICYHIIWIPKWRSQILKGQFKSIIESALVEKASQLDLKLEKYEIMPDHIHLFIRCKPTQSISNIVKHLKGYSSYKLRSIYPIYRKKYKALWASGYYCESIGHISEATIKKYIENQWAAKKYEILCSNSSPDFSPGFSCYFSHKNDLLI